LLANLLAVLGVELDQESELMARHYDLASVKEIQPKPAPGERHPAQDGDAPPSATEQQRRLVAASLLLCPDRGGARQKR
jgi:hypothetical protein